MATAKSYISISSDLVRALLARIGFTSSYTGAVEVGGASSERSTGPGPGPGTGTGAGTGVVHDKASTGSS